MRFLLIVLALVSLCSCAPSYSTADWSSYVSKDQPLRFIAAASCDTHNFFSPVDADAAFFEVGSVQEVAGQPWQYDVIYMTGKGWRRDRFNIKQWWSAAKRQSAPTSARQDNQTCAVLADIPRSKQSLRPYYIEPADEKAAEHKSLTAWVAVIVFAELFLLTCVLIPSLMGYEQFEQRAIAACAAVGVLMIGAIAYGILLHAPWSTFETALRYYRFFDDLPRTASGNLLPLEARQLYFLIAGPPHPADMQFHFAPFAIITGVLAIAWLIFVLPAFVSGLYWLKTPLPLQEVHEQAVREGRAPTAAEIDAAVLKANLGKSVWQLNIMRRKAEVFARNLSGVANHL